jgi:hypothetical protein
MRNQNPNVGRQIAFKVRMKKLWETDRDRMVKRSRAGGKAMRDKSARNKNWWAIWLGNRDSYLTKESLIAGITKSMDQYSTTRPSSVLARLIRQGLVRFDDERMAYRNLSQNI